MNYQRFPGSSSGMMGVRNYVILVEAATCRVQRVVESPPEGTLDDNVLYSALEKKWRDLASQYTWPQFDIISGRGDLQLIRNALPACIGWEMVKAESLL